MTILIVSVVFISGCDGEGGSTAAPSQKESVPDITEEQKQAEILATATHAYVDATSKNWDADAEKDGVIVYPELKDANDETVKFEGVELDVDIEIWTTELDEDWKEVKDRKVYSGSGTIDSWKDGNFMFDGGIRIPFEDIKTVASDDEYGLLLIKIHTPDGKVYEAKQDFGVRIKPE